MNENYNDEHSNSSSKKLDICKIDTVKSDRFIELEEKNPSERSSSSTSNRDTETSFTKALLKKVKIEEEEENMKKLMKKTQKLISQIKSLSRTKFNSNVIGEDDDQYLKNLIKVNEIKVTDELIKNIIKKLQRPKEDKISRNHSTILKTPYKFELYSNSNSSSTDNLDVFDDILDDEKKITLQNTIINKFHKEVLEEFQN